MLFRDFGFERFRFSLLFDILDFLLFFKIFLMGDGDFLLELFRFFFNGLGIFKLKDIVLFFGKLKVIFLEFFLVLFFLFFL